MLIEKIDSIIFEEKAIKNIVDNIKMQKIY